MGFGKDQIKKFVKDLLKEVGKGWDYFTDDTKDAYIARRAFLVCLGQDRESVDTKVMQELYQAMLVEADLADPDDDLECKGCGVSGNGRVDKDGLCGDCRCPQ